MEKVRTIKPIGPRLCLVCGGCGHSHVARKQAEKEQASAAAASGRADSERIKNLEKMMEEMMKERKADKARIEELYQC